MAKIQWGRVILGAVCLELALIVVFVPLLARYGVAALGPYVTAGCFVFGVLVSWWFVRKVVARHILHGALLGLFATLIYLGLGVFAPGGLSSIAAEYGMSTFVLANILRIIGCVVGAMAARR